MTYQYLVKVPSLMRLTEYVVSFHFVIDF